MDSRASILVVGHACLDSVTVLSRVAGENEKVEAVKAWTGGGGPAANAAVALRRLGHDVRLWCAIGDDAAGRIVLDELREEGIDLVAGASEGATSLAQIRAVDAARSIAWKRGDVAPLAPDPRRIEEALDGVDTVYLDGHEVEAASAVLLAARARGLRCMADLGSLRPGAERWLPELEWVVVAPRFVQALSGCTTTAKGLRALRAAAGPAAPVGITLGERGGWVETDGRVWPWIARKTGVVDSTGAGDAFHAGLADGWLQGWDFERCLQWAATLGAAVCRGPGGRLFLPRDRELLAKWHGRWGQHPSMDSAALQETCV